MQRVPAATVAPTTPMEARVEPETAVEAPALQAARTAMAARHGARQEAGAPLTRSAGCK